MTPSSRRRERSGLRVGGIGSRRDTGESAEEAATRELARQGWAVLARNVRVGRGEMDILAVEPAHGPEDPATLVFVEVRSRTCPRFGAPEESVDAGKVARLYRAALAVLHGGRLPDGSPVAHLRWRIDLLTMVRAAPGSDWRAGRHIRGLTQR